MEVETVAADGEFKMPKKALKRKIAEAEKVTILVSHSCEDLAHIHVGFAGSCHGH